MHVAYHDHHKSSMHQQLFKGIWGAGDWVQGSRMFFLGTLNPQNPKPEALKTHDPQIHAQAIRGSDDEVRAWRAAGTNRTGKGSLHT